MKRFFTELGFTGFLKLTLRFNRLFKHNRQAGAPVRNLPKAAVRKL